MRMMIRTVLAALAFAATSALAAWPEKPIKVLIGYAPGGSTDLVARLLGPKLSERLGQPVVIENKPGGAGDFAAEQMLQAPADGYTLLMTTVAVHAINPGLMKQRFHPLDDFTPVALVGSYPMIMIGSPQTTFKTLNELRNFAEPTSIRSSGVGSPGTSRVSCWSGPRREHHARATKGRAVGALRSCQESAGELRHAAAVVPQIRGGGARRGLPRRSAVQWCLTCRRWRAGPADFDVGTWIAFAGLGYASRRAENQRGRVRGGE
jgi:hypothetical protein